MLLVAWPEGIEGEPGRDKKISSFAYIWNGRVRLNISFRMSPEMPATAKEKIINRNTCLDFFKPVNFKDKARYSVYIKTITDIPYRVKKRLITIRTLLKLELFKANKMYLSASTWNHRNNEILHEIRNTIMKPMHCFLEICIKSTWDGFSWSSSFKIRFLQIFACTYTTIWLGIRLIVG